MGNTSSFIIKHGKRLKNRYNAQYRALEFISKENRPSAPRHPVPSSGNVAHDKSFFQELHKKDLKLDQYLKDVYVRSQDEVVQEDSHARRNNPQRPLPESREAKPKATFKEPEEVDKGWCTITQISEFIASHEEDPETNNTKAIAEKYSVDEKKVENTLKYFSVFRLFDPVRDTVPQNRIEETIFTDLEDLKEAQKKVEKFQALTKKQSEENKGKEGTLIDNSESSQPVEKAIKN